MGRIIINFLVLNMMKSAILLVAATQATMTTQGPVITSTGLGATHIDPTSGSANNLISPENSDNTEMRHMLNAWGE